MCSDHEASTGKWTLPGGWADVNLTPAENVERECRGEGGEVRALGSLLSWIVTGPDTREPASITRSFPLRALWRHAAVSHETAEVASSSSTRFPNSTASLKSAIFQRRADLSRPFRAGQIQLIPSTCHAGQGARGSRPSSDRAVGRRSRYIRSNCPIIAPHLPYGAESARSVARRMALVRCLPLAPRTAAHGRRPANRWSFAQWLGRVLEQLSDI